MSGLSPAAGQEAARFAARWTSATLDRLEPWVHAPKPWRVLEIGAAHGHGLIALARLGHRACGVEPDREALAVARRLSEQEGVAIDLREGVAEAIPFPDGTFDLVIATSVLEHVDDLERSLREVHRVLRVGGMFWFNAASAMCPRQKEIHFFPAFGWYPDRLKRTIMAWARDHRPELVNHSRRPAFHWFTPGKARRKLEEARFAEVMDRWDLRRPGEDSGLRGRAVALFRRHRALRFLGDVCIGECAFAARRVA
jgi:SAM-dependent methyltransferase